MTRKRKVAHAIIVLLLAGFAGCFVSALSRARFVARQTMCVHNLKVIAIQLRMYADEHDGAFPDKWSTMITYLQTTTPEWLDQFVCPEQRRRYKVTGAEDVDERSSYVLVPGLRVTDDKDTILAYEKGDNHGGIGHSVLYLDGRGGWEPPSNWR